MPNNLFSDDRLCTGLLMHDATANGVMILDEWTGTRGYYRCDIYRLFQSK